MPYHQRKVNRQGSKVLENRLTPYKLHARGLLEGNQADKGRLERLQGDKAAEEEAAVLRAVTVGSEVEWEEDCASMIEADRGDCDTERGECDTKGGVCDTKGGVCENPG